MIGVKMCGHITIRNQQIFNKISADVIANATRMMKEYFVEI